jgi:hypothetical protein
MVRKDHQEQQEHEGPVDRQVPRVSEVEEAGGVHRVILVYLVW